MRRHSGNPRNIGVTTALVFFPWLLLQLWLPSNAARAGAAGIDESLEVVSKTNREAARSQQQVDRLALATRDLLEEYRRLTSSNDYQAAYARELQELEQAQLRQIATLRARIHDAEITQQRLLPLLHTMADALEKFVVLDLPFHQEDRLSAMADLKQRLRRPDLSIAARFRLMLEAWQLELEYGNTIEAYRDTLMQDGTQKSVRFLRLGRVALYYQTQDGSDCGYWDRAQQRWTPLAPQYARAIALALRVAANELAPELLPLPLPTPVGGPS